jgi:uroporphyrin-3 C-methyltransferase
MNSEATPPESPPTAANRVAAALGGRKLRLALAIAAVAFVALWLDARLTLSGVREDLARRLADSDTQTKEARGALRQTQEGVQALQGRVGALEAQLAESQGQRLTLEAMYQELSKSRDERVIAEVEQAVSIAAQQLQLAGNVEAALIALAGADARLARAAGPQFLGVRKLIARDVDRLRALPTADVPGMAVKLESVIAGVDAMPLAFEQRPLRGDPPKKAAAAAKAQPPAWERLAAEAWAELRQLVRIERIDGAGAVDPGLLSPSQTFFLRENLKLRLVNARLALLSRDARSFREDMRQARAWIERYFDVRAKPVQTALATIKTLGAADVAVEPPTLNETLAALRNFKTTKR